MGKCPSDGKPRQPAGRQEHFRRTGGTAHHKPDAPHAGVQLQMSLYGDPGCDSGVRKRLGVIGVQDRLGDVIFRQLFGKLRRGDAENQDLPVNPGVAQPHCFLQIGNAKTGNTGSCKFLCNHPVAVTVSVSLDHRQKLRRIGQAGADSRNVLIQGVQINLRPGAS